MNDKTLGVAMVKHVCPVCAEYTEDSILMNTRLTQSNAKKVEEANGQIIGYMDEPCPQCQEYMKQGCVLITVDETRTQDWKNPFRTGGFFVLKDEAISRIFDESMSALVIKKRVGYIQHEAAVQLGFFQQV